jgi:hypothetical protein
MAKYINDFRAGDTVKIKLQYPSDISDYEFWFTLKANFEDDDLDAVLQAHTVAGDFTGDDPTNGLVFIVVEAVDTLGIASGKYYYDVQEVTPLGEVRTLVPPVDDYKDRIFVAPNITVDA